MRAWRCSRNSAGNATGERSRAARRFPRLSTLPATSIQRASTSRCRRVAAISSADKKRPAQWTGPSRWEVQALFDRACEESADEVALQREEYDQRHDDRDECSGREQFPVVAVLAEQVHQPC